MLHSTRGRALAALGGAALVLALVGLGTALFRPAPTLDAGELGSVVPTKHDLPGFAPYNGLTGSLAVPASFEDGRTVLTGRALEHQCRRHWREQHDAWACDHVRGVGMVVLERSENVFFRVLSNVVAYDDEDAAKSGLKALTADARHQLRDNKGVRERPGRLADASVTFRDDGLAATEFRRGTVVVETIVWDGSGQVPAQDESAMAKRWPALQLKKLDEKLD